MTSTKIINSRTIQNRIKANLHYLLLAGKKNLNKIKKKLGKIKIEKHLCNFLLTGPRCPKPEAMVFISTCFQQQYGKALLQHGLFFVHLVSSIKSLLSSPNETFLYFKMNFLN